MQFFQNMLYHNSLTTNRRELIMFMLFAFSGKLMMYLHSLAMTDDVAHARSK